MTADRPSSSGRGGEGRLGLADSIDRLFGELESGELETPLPEVAEEEEEAPAVELELAEAEPVPESAWTFEPPSEATPSAEVEPAAEAAMASEVAPPAELAAPTEFVISPVGATISREVDQRASTDAIAAELEQAVTSFLARPEAARAELSQLVEQLSERLTAAGELHPVLMSVQRLALDADGRDGGSMWLARKMMSPELARAMASRLGTLAREEVGRQRLTGMIARFGEVMAPALGEALSNESERVARRAYIEALIALGDDALPVIREMAADERWFVVRNAMLLLRDVGGAEAMDHFTAALAHADPRVRREALVSLAHTGGESAALLVPSKLSDPDTEVRQAAARAAGALRVERAVRPLLERLDAEPDTPVQEAILLALGQIGDPGAVPAIEKRAAGGLFARKAPSSVRVAAYRALAAIGTPHARKLVDDAASDRDPEVRAAAQHLTPKPG